MLSEIDLQGKNKEELIDLISFGLQKEISSQAITINYLREQINLLKCGKFGSSKWVAGITFDESLLMPQR